MGIAPTEFEYLRKFLRERSAIVLDQDKQYLAESRLAPLVPKEGFASVQNMLEELRSSPSGTLHRKVLDAMTNNETWFFRDIAPFEALRSVVLPDLVSRRSSERRLTIWSAAASTGQEAYSVSMLIREQFPGLLGWDLQILATDISSAVLERAQRAQFSQLEVNRGLPVQLLTKYFTREGIEWKLADSIARMVRFRQVNLAELWPEMPSPDVVLLRNVLIYFDIDTKRQILARVARHMRTDGYLFLGCAETTLNLSDNFERIQAGNTFCYRLQKEERR